MRQFATSNAAATHGKIWERAQIAAPLKLDKARNLQLPQLLLKFDRPGRSSQDAAFAAAAATQPLTQLVYLPKFGSAARSPTRTRRRQLKLDGYYVNLKVEKKYLTL